MSKEKKQEPKQYLLKKTRETIPPKEISKEPQGIRTELNELKQQIQLITGTESGQELKKGKFKLPWKIRGKIRNLKKLIAKNQIQVMLLTTNRGIQPTIGDLISGMLIIGDKIYDGAADVVWLWNGKVPTAIVPEWDIKPLTPEYLHSEAEINSRIIHPQTIMIRAMELKEAMQKSKMPSMKILIWILLGAIVVGYIIFANAK